MKFELTEDHIRAGKQGNCSMCPVALCLREQAPDSVVTGIQTSTRSRSTAETWAGITVLRVRGEYYRTPPEVSSFITRFDDGKTVKPFSFEVDLMSELHAWDSACQTS